MGKKWFWQALIAFFALLLLVALSCSPKPVSVVKSFEKAYNNHDLDKLLSLYAEDISFEVVGQFMLQGKEELRSLTEYHFALNIQMSLRQYRTNGDSVVCELTETNDWLKTAGIEKAYYSATFVVNNGLIRSLRAELTPEKKQALKRVRRFLMEWALQERPGLLAEMMPEGKFVYNAKNARKSLTLLREWKQSSWRKGLRPIWKKLGE